MQQNPIVDLHCRPLGVKPSGKQNKGPAPKPQAAAVPQSEHSGPRSNDLNTFFQFLYTKDAAATSPDEVSFQNLALCPVAKPAPPSSAHDAGCVDTQTQGSRNADSKAAGDAALSNAHRDSDTPSELQGSSASEPQSPVDAVSGNVVSEADAQSSSSRPASSAAASSAHQASAAQQTAQASSKADHSASCEASPSAAVASYPQTLC